MIGILTRNSKTYQPLETHNMRVNAREVFGAAQREAGVSADQIGVQNRGYCDRLAPGSCGLAITR